MTAVMGFVAPELAAGTPDFRGQLGFVNKIEEIVSASGRPYESLK
jgi:hypothetical protein